jgi:hypothetical protein
VNSQFLAKITKTVMLAAGVHKAQKVWSPAVSRWEEGLVSYVFGAHGNWPNNHIDVGSTVALMPRDWQCRKGEPMKTPASFVERRERPRVGVMAQVEDITYRVLRKHGVEGGLGHQRPLMLPITERK